MGERDRDEGRMKEERGEVEKLISASQRRERERGRDKERGRVGEGEREGKIERLHYRSIIHPCSVPNRSQKKTSPHE